MGVKNIVVSEGSGLMDSVYGKFYAPIKMLIEHKGEAFEQQDLLKDLFSMQKSEHAMEGYTSLTELDGFEPVGEGGSYPQDGMEEGFKKVLENVTWKDRFTVTQEMVEDTKTIDLKKKPEKLVRSYYRTRARFGAGLYGKALTGADKLTFRGWEFSTRGADGEIVFSKNHPGKVSGKKQSNLFSDAFSVDALSAVETEMQNFRNDNDQMLDVAPDTIVIPNLYKLKKDVFAAVGADKDPNTANNGFNFQFGRWRIIVWNGLNEFVASGTAPWLLLDSKYNEDYLGAVLQDRIPLTIKSIIDDANDNNVWNGRARFTGGFNDWRFAAAGGVAGGTKATGN